MIRLRLHSAVSAELRDAAKWYENRRQGLGRELLAEVERAFTAIRVSPATWPTVDGVDEHVHRILLRRFPYYVVYRLVEGGDVLIVAVAHAKRRPAYWAARSRDR